MKVYKNEKGSVIIYVLVISAVLMISAPVLLSMSVSSQTIIEENEDLKLVTLSSVSAMEMFVGYVENVQNNIGSIEDLKDFPGMSEGDEIEITLPDETKVYYYMELKEPDNENDNYTIVVKSRVGNDGNQQIKSISYEISNNNPFPGGGSGGDNGNFNPNLNYNVKENENIGISYVLGNSKNLKQASVWYDTNSENYTYVIYNYITDKDDLRSDGDKKGGTGVDLCRNSSEQDCSDIKTGKIPQNRRNIGALQYRIITQTLTQSLVPPTGSQSESIWYTPFGVAFNSDKEAFVWFTPDSNTFDEVTITYNAQNGEGINQDVMLNYDSDTGRYENTLYFEEGIDSLKYHFEFKVNDDSYKTSEITVPVFGMELNSDKDEALLWFIPQRNNYDRVEVVYYDEHNDVINIQMDEKNGRYEYNYSQQDQISLLQFYIVPYKNNRNEDYRTYWYTYLDDNLYKKFVLNRVD
ncbi:hypothetical protein [Chengkuizengella sediminis]|uniref:hypothetical protein n=1 Tax=Chengkuizengella sediminis TaxID=1885917 RepID=UPI00138A0EA0|nr:hypothetical protein [Chengkuizengella sediminis]NDI35410.1 hypothetical protein [Chengkuizengella sediminis]